MRTRQLLVLVPIIASLGCSWAITGDGAFANFGQSSITTCEATVDGQAAGECTTIEGAPLSQQAGAFLGGIVATALRLLGVAGGVPAAP